MSVESTSISPPLIIGCGAIGGLVGSELLKRGYAIRIATTNPDVRRVWATTGPYLDNRLISRPLESQNILEHSSQSASPVDLALVAVPPPQIETVGADLAQVLRPDGLVVCLSNGWCEPHLAERLGANRVAGAVVTWGARMTHPGHYLRTSKGGFVLGALDSSAKKKLARAAQLLQVLGNLRFTDDLMGARLSKLVINCAVSGLGTVGGRRLGELLSSRRIRRIGIHLLGEAIDVARAHGVQLQPIAGIDWANWRTHSPRRRDRLAQHSLLLAVGVRYRYLRSSILVSIERGRPPAIDFINGEISRLGQQVRVPTPFNDAVVSTVWKLARAEMEAGPQALDEVERLARLAT